MTKWTLPEKNDPFKKVTYQSDEDEVKTKIARRTENMVDHPPHYNSANIECIEAMKAMSEGANISNHQAYCWQNSFKYLWRWPYKNGVEDLKKTRWYLDRLIKEVEKE